MFVKILNMLFAVYIVYVETNAMKEYGTFNLTITQFDMCKGPKHKDCATAKASINNSATLNYDLIVLQNVTPTKGKIVAYSNGKEFLRLQLKKPCEHLFLRPLFSTLMNVTKDCIIIKGEFDLKVSKLEPCKGPKRKDCVEIGTKIVNDVFLDLDFNILENVKTIKAKIIGLMDNKELMRLQIKNLCDHIFFKPLLQGLFNNSDHCGMEKGHYRLHVDVQAIARKFYGGRFIYGDWRFKWISYNDNCNFHCATMFLTMSPKKVAVGD